MWVGDVYMGIPESREVKYKGTDGCVFSIPQQEMRKIAQEKL